MTENRKGILEAALKSTTLVLLIALLFVAGCARPMGSTPNDKKANIRVMRNNTLKELYYKRPEAKAKIANAPGYAVFSNFGVNVILVSAGNGYGILVENDSGRETFMRMGQVGIGPGIGVKDFRAVFIFHSREDFQTFLYQGWDFGASAEATAVSGDSGGEASGADSFSNVEVYQFTESGISLQATIAGTKYWMDKELN